MGSYRITTDIFTLNYKEEKQVLYAPLLGFACEINNDMVHLLSDLEGTEDHELSQHEKAILEYLIQRGVVNGKTKSAPVHDVDKKVRPSKLTLFPTNQCNMRCRYCYASAGTSPPKTMDWEIATSAIDYYITVLKKEKRTVFPLELHGGGEPLYAWALVKGLIEYAEEKCNTEGFKTEVYAGTNGVLNRKQLDWLIGHFKALNISFEGLPHVQDYQRPMANGSSSFKKVDETLKFLDEHNFPYGIRCTVTTYNENILPETIDFITENYKTKLIYLEPVYLCDRYKILEENLRPDLFKFVENFKKLEPICAERHVRLGYSGAALERLSRTFCYVGTDDFAVTPDGCLTNCWEVTSRDHPLAETFIFGRILPEGRIEVDKKKLAFLRSLSVDHLEYCQDCFAKWHCAGDCVAKLKTSDYRGPRGSERCETNRFLIAHQIFQLLERKDYYEKELVNT